MSNITKQTPTVECIQGVHGSGKTERLVQQVASLLKDGHSQTSIAVLCATPDAAAHFALRLQTAAGTAIEGISITTPCQMARAILATPEAVAFTGRPPRILTEFEHNFLLEDMKTSGLKPRRLKEMLKFFYRSISEMADHEQGWLIHAEEEKVFNTLQEYLCMYNGMLECEVSNRAVSYVKNNTEQAQKFLFAHVFVDDYQNISKASQALSFCLATERITIAGNSDEALTVFEPYPYPQGLDELCASPDGHTVTMLEGSRLPQQVQDAGARLLELAQQEQGALADLSEALISTGGTVDADSLAHEASNTAQAQGGKTDTAAATSWSEDNTTQDSIKVLACSTIPNEFEEVAAYVDECLSTKELEPSDVFIVAPNANWATHLARFLEARAIETDTFAYGQALKGDIRDSNKCASLRLYSALRLVADPQDDVSWRCWCGFGDYLTQSTVFHRIKDLVLAQRVGLAAILEALSKAEEGHASGLDDLNKGGELSWDVDVQFLSDASPVLNLYRQGLRLVEQCQGQQGKALLEELVRALGAQAGYDVLTQLAGGVQESDTAAHMVTRIEQALLAPRFSNSATCVRIGPPESTCGLTPQLLIYTGFVNGFIPSRDYFDRTKTTLEKQSVLLQDYVHMLYATIGKAGRRCAFSYFVKSDLESAELLKLKFERIRLEDGVKVCAIAPSMFLPVICPEAVG